MFNFSQTENDITPMDCSYNNMRPPSMRPPSMRQPSMRQPTVGSSTLGPFSNTSPSQSFHVPLTTPTLDKSPMMSNNPHKKNKQTTDSGINIVNKIDYTKLGNDFVKFYYINITTVQPIVPYLRQSTVFKFSNKEYDYNKLPALFDQLKKYTFNIEKVEVLPSGSRRLDIIVSGNLNGSSKFSQYFLLCNEKEQLWYIKSSLLV